MSAGFAVIGPLVIPILYGHTFQQSAVIVALIGVLQTARFLVVWPTTVALARGRSNIVLANTIFRLISWPAALVGVAVGQAFLGIVAGFIFGEIAANAGALMMFNRNEENPIFQDFGRFVSFVIGSTIIVSWAALAASPSPAHGFVLIACSVLFIAWLARSETAAIRAMLEIARRFIRGR
jgi:hypothetical protein